MTGLCRISRRGFGLGAGAALLAGRAGAQGAPLTYPEITVTTEFLDWTPDDERDMRSEAVTVRRRFNEQLIDYPGARFRDVEARRVPGQPVVFMGYVNSRNRMGAYSGWTRFAADVGSVTNSPTMINLLFYPRTGRQYVRLGFVTELLAYRQE